MKESEDDIENLFRERFSDEEAPISPRVWNNIKQTLPENTNPSGHPGNGKIILLTGILLTAMVACGSWFVYDKVFNNEIKSLTSNHKKQTNQDSSQKNSSQTIDPKNSSFNSVAQKVEVLNTEDKKDNPQKNLVIQDIKVSPKRIEEEDLKEKNVGVRKNGKIILPKRSKHARNGRQATYRKGGPSEDGQLDNRIEANQQGRKNKEKHLNQVLHKKTNLISKDSEIKRTDKGNLHRLDSSSDLNAIGLTNNPLVKAEKDLLLNEKGLVSSKEIVLQNNQIEIDKKQQHSKDDLSLNSSKEQEKVMDQNSENKLQEPSSHNPDKKKEMNFTTNDSLQKKTSSIAVEDSLPFTGKKNEVENQASINNGRSDSTEYLSKTTADIVVSDSVQLLSDTSIIASMDSIQIPDTTLKKEDMKSMRLSRWSMDIVVTPMLTGASTKAVGTSYQSAVEAKNGQDKDLLNFSAGGMVNYSIYPRFYVSAGVFYTAYTEKYNFKNSVSKDTLVDYQHYVSFPSYTLDTAGNVIDTTYQDSLVTDQKSEVVTKEYSAKKKDQYSFLSLPISASFYLLKRDKFLLSATAGVRVNLLMKSATYVTNQEMTNLVEYKSGISKVTFSYMASVSMEYQIKRNIYLLAQPGFNYHANSIYNKSSSLSQKPYSIGLNAGLRIKF